MNNINVDVKTLRPLTRFIYTIGALPSSYLMSMSYEEQLIWLCNYLETTVIPTINNNAHAVEEVQHLVIELKNEIENLDLQDEVDNKLEEMLESGQLAEIVAQFLEYAGVFGFDTKADLKAGTSFVNGSIAMTLGENTYNDGKINFYKIRNVLTTDVIDDNNILAITSDPTLIAEKIHNYYINEIYNLAIANKELIRFNKVNQLTDNLQLFNRNDIYEDIFGEDNEGWSVTGIEIIGNKGYCVANDWTQGGSGGTKFNLISFDFVNGEISNPNIELELYTGHTNDICKLSDTEILICCSSNLIYKYNITNNDIETINNLPYIYNCSRYNDKIYLTQFYNANNEETNQLFEYSYNNGAFTLLNTYTIDNLYTYMNGSIQGSVIYDNLLIYPSHTPMKLCIVDLDTKKFIKNQLFVNPYIIEIESGYVYNNELYLIDADGHTFKPDLYNKKTYGGEPNIVLTKSNTDVELFNTPKRINFNTNNIIEFRDFFKVMSRSSNTDIDVMGTQFESITIYLGLATEDSVGCDLLTPITIPCFKSVANAGLKNNADVSVTAYNNRFYATKARFDQYKERWEIAGNIIYGGGDTSPNINIVPYQYVALTNLTDNSVTLYDTAETQLNLYLLKIVGHRKVGLGY